MGVRDLAKSSGAFQAAKSMYGFSVDSYPSLERAAQEAVRRIYSAGLMFRNGELGPGGNNVLADFAALAFSKEQLRNLKNNNLSNNQVLAEIIALRQEYAENDQRTDLLHKIYQNVQSLKSSGWSPGAEPVKLNGFTPV